MNKTHLTYDLLKKYSKHNIGFIKSPEAVLTLKKYFNYVSPNVHSVFFLSDSVTFYVTRYVGADVLHSQTVFDLESNVLKITEYEKQYLQNKKDF